MNAMLPFRSFGLPSWLFVFALASAPIVAYGADKTLSFNRDIRPILSDACFQCHGPDSRQLKAGLRLDVRDHALKPAESGATAIVPGKAEASELIKRITSADDGERMPPAGSGKKVSPQQIEILKRWIAEGAEYEGHWAFLPVHRPTVPAASTAPKSAISNQQLEINNPIDAFIRARLVREGLSPSPAADKPTLIRRVTLDLTGLPPTLAEVDAFLADNSADAYEKVVDRLLASSRYGERMALQWLDFARYADSNGFQTDGSRFQWPWRDWVINAFNQNMPFDQFTIEQLAGDMLPDATLSQVVATGFNRNHKLNGEGGIIAEEWRVETVIDRVETTGLTWLALTLNCCRCHDHKYDPISQSEFYSLFAFFNNVTESGTLQGDGKNTEPTVAVTTAEHAAEIAQLDAAIIAAEAKVKEANKRLPEYLADWEPKFREQIAGQTAAWNSLSPTEVKSKGGATLTRQEDGSYLASGKNPDKDTYQIVAPLGAGSFSGLLLECFVDPSLPEKSLGRYSNGNFVLSRVEAEITAPTLKEPLRAVFNKAEADYSQKGYEVGLVVDKKNVRGWAIDGPTKKENRKAMFLVEKPLNVPAGATLTVRLIHEAIGGHNIGRFRLSATSLPLGTVKLDGVQFPAAVKEAISIDAAKRTPAQKAELQKFFKANVDSPIKQAENEVAAAKKKRDDRKGKLPSVMVMREGQPRDAYRLIRGEYDKKGEKVAAGLPAALPPMPAGEAMNRLGLARWIVSPTNPLTARVWVNRAWERFFGIGLVKTSENFGSQSEFPSHPDLLDWLAAEFMQPTVTPAVNGQPAKPWDMKALQKLIVMSATYRQASGIYDFELMISDLKTKTPNSSASENQKSEIRNQKSDDPENRLLARGPRIRLSGETLRDQALFVSGLLVEKIGGPSVRPYMPDGVWDETSRYGDLRGYKHATDDGLYRRSMYTVWKRTAAPPTMLIFDAPNREICTVKRSRTNTPLQALSLLNEITYVEAARKLAERMLSEGGETPAARIAYGFRLATSRTPTDDELKILTTGLAADLVRCEQAKEEIGKLVAFGESKPSPKYSSTDLAAYTLTANVLLNLDEVVTRE